MSDAPWKPFTASAGVHGVAAGPPIDIALGVPSPAHVRAYTLRPAAPLDTARHG